MQDARWPILIAVAYCFGAFLNHNLFLAIHELSHNLAFSTPIYNRFLGVFANLPISIPMSVTFQKYHLEHHRYQGVEGYDMDIPSYTEGRVVTNTLAKILWVLCQLFFYALRPLFLNPKAPGLWEVSNLVAQLSFDAALIYCSGWKALIYLVLSTFLGGGMHPIAGHFIAEHYVFLKGQETYSYYGPLNFLAWNVGYHVEHHDFPRIPGCKLYRVSAKLLALWYSMWWRWICACNLLRCFIHTYIVFRCLRYMLAFWLFIHFSTGQANCSWILWEPGSPYFMDLCDLQVHHRLICRAIQ